MKNVVGVICFLLAGIICSPAAAMTRGEAIAEARKRVKTLTKGVAYQEGLIGGANKRRPYRAGNHQNSLEHLWKAQIQLIRVLADCKKDTKCIEAIRSLIDGFQAAKARTTGVGNQTEDNPFDKPVLVKQPNDYEKKKWDRLWRSQWGGRREDILRLASRMSCDGREEFAIKIIESLGKQKYNIAHYCKMIAEIYDHMWEKSKDEKYKAQALELYKKTLAEMNKDSKRRIQNWEKDPPHKRRRWGKPNAKAHGYWLVLKRVEQLDKDSSPQGMRKRK